MLTNVDLRAAHGVITGRHYLMHLLVCLLGRDPSTRRAEGERPSTLGANRIRSVKLEGHEK
jgi:hypothetical protein